MPVEAPVADGVPAGIVKGEPLELAADIATWKVQVADAFSEPPVSDRLVADAEGEKVAPQVFDAFGVAATTTPDGNVIGSATPESADVLGLVSVTVMVEVPPATIDVGLSVVTEVGAEADATDAQVTVYVALNVENEFPAWKATAVATFPDVISKLPEVLVLEKSTLKLLSSKNACSIDSELFVVQLIRSFTANPVDPASVCVTCPATTVNAAPLVPSVVAPPTLLSYH